MSLTASSNLPPWQRRGPGHTTRPPAFARIVSDQTGYGIAGFAECQVMEPVSLPIASRRPWPLPPPRQIVLRASGWRRATPWRHRWQKSDSPVVAANPNRPADFLQAIANLRFCCRDKPGPEALKMSALILQFCCVATPRGRSELSSIIRASRQDAFDISAG